MIGPALFLLLGAAAGPQGLALLTDNVLLLVDPVIPVALAAFGVLVALEIGAWNREDGPLLAGASVQGLLVATVVGGGTWLVAPLLVDLSAVETSVLAIVLGLCASASSRLALDTSDGTGARAARLVDLDALLPVVLGGVVIAAVRGPEWLPALWLAAQAVGMAMVIAVAGWLLLARTSLDTEQRVFSLAILLLLGGIADYLSLSALLAGLVAGACWHAIGGATRESIRHDVTRLRHPLLAVALLVAGARAEVSAGIVALAVVYVLLRATGKLAGSLVILRMVRTRDARGLVPRLLAPGIVGVAFALNAARAAGTEMSVALSVAVLGTIGAHLLAGRAPAEARE